MTRDTFQALLDKTAPFRSALRFIGWGEPTMHPNLAKFVYLAAEAGRLTHLNTNGSLLLTRPLLAQDLVASGLSSIKFSFQGTDPESYYAMRRTDFFDDLLRSIARVRAVRGFNAQPLSPRPRLPRPRPRSSLTPSGLSSNLW